jgi:RNA polymerase sigma-70 factor (ECF subfamily)
MSAEESFQSLLRRVRAGDEAAAAEVVRLYEPEIRRLVRLRLTDPRLGRLLDSMDVCQSVLANFFVRAAAGQFELSTPGQLLRLLATMARHKLLNQARKEQADRRNPRRLCADGERALKGAVAPGETPSEVVAGAELLEKARALLSDEERALAERRAEGRDWEEIARTLGGSPEALRKKLARAMDRVARRLGLQDRPGR